jgi:hypothetical protein
MMKMASLVASAIESRPSGRDMLKESGKKGGGTARQASLLLPHVWSCENAVVIGMRQALRSILDYCRPRPRDH